MKDKVVYLSLVTVLFSDLYGGVSFNTNSIKDEHSYQFGVNYYFFGNKHNGSAATTSFIWGENNTTSISKRPSSYLKRQESYILSGGGNGALPYSDYNEKPHIIESGVLIQKPNIKEPNIKVISVNANINVPIFEPKTITIPQNPTIISPAIPQLNPPIIKSGGANPEPKKYVYFGPQNYAVISQVMIDKGHFYRDKDDIKITQDYIAKLPHDPANTSKLISTRPYINNTITEGTHYTIDSDNNNFIMKAGDYKSDAKFFYTYLEIPYLYFGKDVKIYDKGNGNDFMFDFEIQRQSNYINGDTFERLYENGVFGDKDTKEALDTKNRAITLRDSMINTVLNFSNKNKINQYFDQKGTIEVGSNSKGFLFTTTHEHGEYGTSIVNNTGKIVILPKLQDEQTANDHRVAIAHSPDTSRQVSVLYSNDGAIYGLAEKSIGMLISASEAQYLAKTDVVFINSGEMVISGRNSNGLAISYPTRFSSHYALLKPIIVRGDGANGVYINLNTNNSISLQSKSYNTSRVIIGDKTPNDTYDFIDKDGATNTLKAESNIDGKDEKYTENANGLLINATSDNQIDGFVKTDIKIDRFSKNSNAIAIDTTANASVMLRNLTNKENVDYEESMTTTKSDGTNKKKLQYVAENDRKHTINIEGGEGNIGLFAKGTGDIEFNGDIIIKNSNQSDGINKAKDNIAIFITDGGEKQKKFKGSIKLGEESDRVSSIGLYTSNNSKLNVLDGSDIRLNLINTDSQNKKVLGLYADKGSNISFENYNNNPKTKLNISIDNSSNPTKEGIGVLATGENTKITLPKSTIINVNGGLSSLVATNKALIEAKGIMINYNSEGVAAYSDGTGKIDLSNATINLDGKSAGFLIEKNQNSNTYSAKGITLTDSKINIKSKDVTAFVANDIDSIQTSTLTNKDILTGINSSNIDYENEEAKKAKILAIDGIWDFKIDSDIDKTAAAKRGDSFDDMVSNDEKIAYNFTRAFGYQRARITLEDGKSIKSHLNDTGRKNLQVDRAAGIIISSSNLVSDNGKTLDGRDKSYFKRDETTVTLKNNTLIDVDNTGNGDGGIGIYINYGKVNTSNSSTINIEKSTQNDPNKNGVGIYAVHSEVDAKGEINVSGENGIGIYSSTYKDKSQTQIIGPEFIDDNSRNLLNNSGAITMDGKGSIGIYANANNKMSNSNIFARELELTNTGTINMLAENSIAIATRDSKVNNSGDIHLKKDNSIGIYARRKNNNNKYLDKSFIEHSGTITSNGQNNVGIYSDLKSINDTNNPLVKINGSSITMKGDNNLAIRVQSILLENANINITGNNSAGIYLTDSGNLHVKSLNDFQINGENSAYVFIDNKPTFLDTSKNNDNDGNYNQIGSDIKALNIVWDATNTIDIKKGSVGFYTKKQQVDGELNPDDKTNIKINSGVFNLYKNSVGIYAADGLNSNIDIKNGVKFVSKDDSSYGLYLENANLNFDGELDMKDTKGNVAVYGQDSVLNFNNNSKISIGDFNGELERAVGIYATNTQNSETKVNFNGTLNINGEGGIGLFGDGARTIIEVGSSGVINVNGNKAVGAYIQNGATLINRGVVNVNGDDSFGAYLRSGAILKNYGSFNVNGNNSHAVYKTDKVSKVWTQQGDLDIKEVDVKQPVNSDIEKDLGNGVKISSVGDKFKVTVNGKEVEDKDMSFVNLPQPAITTPTKVVDIKFENIESKLNPVDFGFDVNKPHSEVGKLENDGKTKMYMYVDTSGVQATHPINGVENLKGNEIGLYIGAEATLYNKAKVVVLKENIIKPFVKAIGDSGANRVEFLSGSYTWQVVANVDTTKTNPEERYKNFVLAKIPYTYFVNKNSPKYELYEALEELYETSSDRKIFNLINTLGKGEGHLFDSIMQDLSGRQYANTQLRIKSSLNTFDREFYDLMDWDTDTKDTTKIKLFGQKSTHNSRASSTLGYEKQTRGLFVLNNFDLDLENNSHGWFAAIAKENYDFKDKGRSNERAVTGQIGYYIDKYNKSKDFKFLSKIALDGQYRQMHRKMLIVDETFDVKGDYYSYGINLENRLYKPFKFENNFSIAPYVGLDLAYGKITNINEKKGNMLLLVKSSNYSSIVPNTGLQFAYSHMLNQGYITASLDANLYKEYGKIKRSKNIAKFRDSQARYFRLGHETKEDTDITLSARLKYENYNFGISGLIGISREYENPYFGIDLRFKF